ncbi:MAG: C-terminal binding protein, partial [Myxococcales bacterium]
PTYCVEEVADHTMALLLACARKVVFFDRMVRSGGWAVPPGKPIFRLGGRTLGIVGFGRIGKQVALRAGAFGMRVLWFDPYLDIEGTDLQTLLRESDFISLHLPLTPQTRMLIGEAELRQMKRTAYVVNCSRGPVVATAALVRALDEGWIAGCAIDTTDPEPLPDPHPLRGRENVILQPHVAWYSEEAMRGLQAGAPSEVRRVLTRTWPVNVVNGAVKERNRAGL